MIYEVTIAEKVYSVELTRAEESQSADRPSAEKWNCKLNGRVVLLDAVFVQNGILSLLLEGKSYEIKRENIASENTRSEINGSDVNVVVGHTRFAAAVRDPRSFRSRQRAGASEQGLKKITAPMPGKVVRILAAVGTQVEAGQSVIVIEAMKMQNELKAPKSGAVKKINVVEGAAVEAGQSLAEIE
jgi:biotin carboxyl carrier protein